MQSFLFSLASCHQALSFLLPVYLHQWYAVYACIPSSCCHPGVHLYYFVLFHMPTNVYMDEIQNAMCLICWQMHFVWIVLRLALLLHCIMYMYAYMSCSSAYCYYISTWWNNSGFCYILCDTIMQPWNAGTWAFKLNSHASELSLLSWIAPWLN